MRLALGSVHVMCSLMGAVVFLFLLILMTVHLSGWNFMSHFCSQSSNEVRSFCRMARSKSLLIGRSIAVSSAKSLVLEATVFGRSFMYVRNKQGPSTEPCGTPDLTLMWSDWLPSTTTACFRSCKKFSIHLEVLPLIP